MCASFTVTPALPTTPGTIPPSPPLQFGSLSTSALPPPPSSSSYMQEADFRDLSPVKTPHVPSKDSRLQRLLWKCVLRSSSKPPSQQPTKPEPALPTVTTIAPKQGAALRVPGSDPRCPHPPHLLPEHGFWHQPGGPGLCAFL